MTPKDLKWDWPELIPFFREMTEDERWLALDLFSLIWDTVKSQYGDDLYLYMPTPARRAVGLFKRLWMHGIKSIADFDCRKLRDMRHMTGIGKVYSSLIKDVWSYRIRNISDQARKGS